MHVDYAQGCCNKWMGTPHLNSLRITSPEGFSITLVQHLKYDLIVGNLGPMKSSSFKNGLLIHRVDIYTRGKGWIYCW